MMKRIVFSCLLASALLVTGLQAQTWSEKNGPDGNDALERFLVYRPG